MKSLLAGLVTLAVIGVSLRAAPRPDRPVRVEIEPGPAPPSPVPDTPAARVRLRDVRVECLGGVLALAGAADVAGVGAASCRYAWTARLLTDEDEPRLVYQYDCGPLVGPGFEGVFELPPVPPGNYLVEFGLEAVSLPAGPGSYPKATLCRGRVEL